MAEIWQLLIKSNTINFLIVLGIIIFLVAKLSISSKIEVLRDEIKKFVDASVQEKENAQKELDEIKEKIVHLPDEIKDIKDTAQKNIKGIEQKIEVEIQEKMQDVENNAKRILNLETKKFKSKLSGILSEASIKLARQNAIEQLEQNRELHDKYINEAIDEIDRISL
ncbi:MAG: hypothetical protein E7Z90_06165 [Cyanobacteria bacterium SIG29]|nr:hypothetical protein [Cyanobacteria bacterium SIG29]